MESTTARRTVNRRVAGFALVGVVAVSAAVYLFTRHAGDSYVVDEWLFVARRQDFSWSSLVQGHNGHLTIVPAFVYLVVWNTFGLGAYWVFRLVAVVWQVATALAVGEVIRRRHGLVPALVGTLIVTVSGTGSENSLFGFQISFMGGLLFFVCSVLCLDEAESTGLRRWDVAAFVAVCLAVGSSGSGVPAIPAVMLLIASRPGRLRRAWIIVPTLVAYAAWYSRYSITFETTHPGPSQFVSFAVDGLAGSLAGIAGVDLMWGRIALGAVAVLVVRDVVRRGFDLRRHIWTVYLLSFWALTSYSRATFGDALASRYLWVGMFCFPMIIAESIPRKVLDRRRTTALSIVGACAVVLFTWGTQPELSANLRFQRNEADVSIGFTRVALANRDRLDPELGLYAFVPGYPLINAREFFSAVDRFGNPPEWNSATWLDTESRRYGADRAFIGYGLADPRPAIGECTRGDEVGSVAVAPGATGRFEVLEEAGVVLTRFREPGATFDFNVRLLEPGTYEIDFVDDGLGSDVTATFNGGRVVACG